MDFLKALSLSLIKERTWGETQDLCLLGIELVIRGARVSNVDVILAANLTVESSNVDGEFMSVGLIVRLSVGEVVAAQDLTFAVCAT